MGRIAGRFARVEPRRRAARLVLGLLADLPRKNCWTIAEWAGETTPDGMQHLLGRAKWNADQVRDDVCGYVVEHLHDDRAVLVVDETGDVRRALARSASNANTPRYSRPDRELPSRRLPGLRRQARPRRSGPGTPRSALLDLRPRPLPRRGPCRGNHLRHQAGAGHSYGRPVPGRRPPGRMGHRSIPARRDQIARRLPGCGLVREASMADPTAVPGHIRHLNRERGLVRRAAHIARPAAYLSPCRRTHTACTSCGDPRCASPSPHLPDGRMGQAQHLRPSKDRWIPRGRRGIRKVVPSREPGVGAPNRTSPPAQSGTSEPLSDPDRFARRGATLRV